MKSKPSADCSNIEWFRSASPYINAHRHRTMVLSLSSNWLNSTLLPTLTHDLTLLSHLGMRLVVCFGLRTQVDARLSEVDTSTPIISGRRVTNRDALDAIVTEAGRARHELEARLSMGLPNTPMSGARLSVSSGNYVTAQPFGIHSGIDFQHTGAVREIHHKAITALLDAGHLVLLPPLGYSLTGDVFNITAIELASACAIALHADKLVYFVDALPVDEHSQPIRQASARSVDELADRMIESNELAQCSGNSGGLPIIMKQAVAACQRGVARVHLLRSSDPNALLTELFTTDGSGMLVTNSLWEHIRKATINDVGGIIELIEPLQASGSLVTRSREQLELDIDHFVVSERDGMVVSCAAMYIDRDEACVEIACLATHPEYRGEGRADQLLQHLETSARQLGYSAARVLSTHAGHWFVERGYSECPVDELPESRRASYSWQRNSKVYQKSLMGSDHET